MCGQLKFKIYPIRKTTVEIHCLVQKYTLSYFDKSTNDVEIYIKLLFLLISIPNFLNFTFFIHTYSTWSFG